MRDEDQRGARIRTKNKGNVKRKDQTDKKEEKRKGKLRRKQR